MRCQVVRTVGADQRERPQKVIELVCRGRGCDRLCCFDVETGEAADVNRLPLDSSLPIAK